MILLNQIMSAVLQLLIFSKYSFCVVSSDTEKGYRFFQMAGAQNCSHPTFEDHVLYPCGIFSGTIFTLSVALSIWQFELSRIYSGRISTNRLEHRNIYSHLDLGCRSDFIIGRNSLSWVSLQAVVQ